MVDRLLGANTKVDRAEEHLRSLQTEVAAFFGSRPYEVRTKRDQQTRRLIYYLARVQSPPVTIPAIAGDVIQNLRSALDHLAYQLVLAGTGSAGPLNYVYFPVADSAAKYESKKTSQLKGTRQDAIKAVDAIQPYKGGNDTLWQIHALNNIDKHRLLVTVGSALRSMDLGRVMMRKLAQIPPRLPEVPSFSAFFQSDDHMCPLKSGDELFIDEPDAEEDEHLAFKFELAFNELQVVEGDEVLETLTKARATVQNVIAILAPFL